MKKTIIVFLIIFVTSFFFGESLDVSYKELYDKFYPSIEGGTNEKSLIGFIENFCSINGIPYKTDLINNEKDIITSSYNLEASIKGGGKNLEQLILVCPLNSLEVNNNYYDNLLSVKIFFELMLSVKNASLKKNVIFLFTGANESAVSEFEGVNFFIQKSDKLSKSFAFIVNLLSIDSEIDFSGSANRKPIPLNVLKKFLVIEKKRLDLNFNKREINKSKFFLLDKQKYDYQFISSGIPSVMFSNKNYLFEKTGEVTPEYQKRLTDYFLNWIISLDDLTFPMDADYHYQHFKFFNYNFLFSEQILIIIIILSALFLIVAWFFFSIKKALHLSLFFKGAPFFLLIYLINLALSFLPLLLFIPIDFIIGSEKSYLNLPFFYFINIFFIPLFIILIIFEKLKKIYFPRHLDLYVYSSVMLLILNMLLFLFIDISLSYIFLWAIIMLSLSSYTGKKIYLRYIFFILSTIPFLYLIYDVSYFKNIEIIKNINPILINVFFTFFIFPFKLLFLAVEQFIKKFKKIFLKRIHYINLIISIVIFTLLSSMLLTALHHKAPKIIYADYNYSDNSNFLKLSSNKIIGKVTVDKDKNYNIFRNSKVLKVEAKEKPYKITFMNGSSFFNYDLIINSVKPIKYINAYLKTKKGSYPVESNYIFNKINGESDKNEFFDIYKFIIPKNIGNNFDLKIALLDGDYELSAEIVYMLFKDESSIDLSDKNADIVAQETFKENFEIKKF